MRQFIIGLTLLVLPAMAIAQGMPGGGGGGMPGGGMPGEGGGGRGGMGRGDRSGMGGGERPAGPGRAPVEFRDIKRDKIDKPVEDMFRAADANGDGIVTIEELHATLASRRAVLIRERFKAIDRNGDKVIDEREFIAWQESLGSLASSDANAGGIDLGLVPDTISPPLGKSAEDNALRLVIEPLGTTVLINANSNYDQGMSLAELLAYERKRFDAADTDHDGTLSLEELRALEPRGRAGGPGSRGPGAGGGGLQAPPRD